MVRCILPTSSTFFAPIALASRVAKLVWSASVAFSENSLSFSQIIYEPTYNSLNAQMLGLY